jgi:hypothetical protein
MNRLTVEMNEILDALIDQKRRAEIRIGMYLNQCAEGMGLDPSKISFDSNSREFKEKEDAATHNSQAQSKPGHDG